MEGRSGTGVSGSSEEGFFGTPLFQAATIGIPFCTFKLLFGMLILRAIAWKPSSLQVIFGWMVILWALTDLMMNLAKAAFYLSGRESPVEYCIIAQIGRILGRPRLFLAIDTLLSFSIISLVLWSGWIRQLTLFESRLWNAATTLNLISISVVNLWTELQRGSRRRRELS